MELTYKFRLYPDKKQKILIAKTFGCTRLVYNHYLGKRIELYDTNKESMTFAKCCNDLTEFKNEKEFLKEVDSTALQASLKNLDRAYQNFFNGLKKGQHVGYPRFKCKHDNRKSFTSKNNKGTVAVYDNCIKLPKLGYVKCKISKEVKGRILSATVSINPAGKYFVAVNCTDVEITPFESTDKTVGIDLGLKDFGVTSDGNKIKNHKYLRKSLKKLAKLQRQLSRKQKGSKNRNKARIKVARLYEKITNQRNDTLHKLSTELVREYDVICMEDLAVKNMVKTRNYRYL